MADEPQLFEDFRDMLAELAAAGAGVVRATLDIDIFVRPSEENASRVVRALRAWGAPLESHGVSATDFGKPGTVYQLGLPPRRIDILTAIDGVSFDEASAAHLKKTDTPSRLAVGPLAVSRKLPVHPVQLRFRSYPAGPIPARATAPGS